MTRPSDTGVNRVERQRLLHERIRVIATKDPELSSTEIAGRVGCANRLVQRVVKEMKDAACAT